MANPDDTVRLVFGVVRALLELIVALFVAALAAVGVTGKGLQQAFGSSPATRQHKEIVKLYHEVKAAFDASRYSDVEAADDFMFAVINDACDRADVSPSDTLVDALFETTKELLLSDLIMFGWTYDEEFIKRFLAGDATLEEGSFMRNFLNRKQRFLADHERLENIWREKVIRIFEGNLGYLPKSAIEHQESDAANDSEEASDATLKVMLTDLLSEPAEAIERTLVSMFDDDVTKARLFDGVRERLDLNVLDASGIRPEQRASTTKQLVLPTQAGRVAPGELATMYLKGTPFTELFCSSFPFRLPFMTRFEHTHIVGGTGHGKTQIMQLMMLHDLHQARDGKGSMVVIDGQGDLIRTVSHLAYFSPTAEKSLADKFLLVDPNDVEHPVCLNMFDLNMDRLKGFSAVDREMILNGTIELYEYIFGALLGAELTQKQGVIFKYLARLMLHIPDATIHTLRELMEDGEPFRHYMEQLDGSSRKFFETQFFTKGFDDTKRQILRRLWGILGNPTFERMFSNPRNKVDMFDAMNEGKIILINTAKDLLKKEGSSIFGRFFIAMITQAALMRSVIAKEKRRSTFCYIDEAHEYFDDQIEDLLNQARKYFVGIIASHQNLDQLSPRQRATFMASTSIKFAGGVSAGDARAFAREMRCSDEFILGARKREDQGIT